MSGSGEMVRRIVEAIEPMLENDGPWANGFGAEDIARAALCALSEPTGTMVEAGGSSLQPHAAQTMDAARECWSAMIAAASEGDTRP